MKKLLSLIILVSMSVTLFAQGNTGDAKVKTPVKPALVVIDVQNEFLKYMSDEKDMALKMINWAIATARYCNIPVIRVYHTNPGWGPKPGTTEFEFDKSVAVNDDDPKVIKNFPSGFKKTDLDKILKEKGINTLFLCGLSATGCVIATYYGGKELDYNVFMLKGAIMSDDHEMTNAVENFTETVTIETFGFMLEHL